MSAAENDTTTPPPLEPHDRRELLRIARVTLKEFLAHGRIPPGAPHRPPLLVPAAAFVTVYVNKELRGCIGHIEADTPMYKIVAELTVKAATEDPRFEPLRLDDLVETRLSISILSPRRRVTPEEVEVGRHGLMITRRFYRGLLLPQVPVEHGWDRETFLNETCHKAGLPYDAWRDPDTLIEAFTADVFGET